MGLEDMMQMAGQVREKLAKAQADAMQTTAEGEAGGGLVKVRVNGRHQVVSVFIEPTLVTSENISLLQDLLRAAVNHANDKLAETIRTRMTDLTKDFGLNVNDWEQMFRGMGDKTP